MAEEPTGFLDLPPEIRNHIYTLLLPNDNRVMIWKFRRRGNARAYIGDLRALSRLLRMNQQIYSEVAPMAYGAVTFHLTVSAGVVRWLRALGSMKQHIRHVYLESWTKTNMRAFFHQLKQARFIQTVTLDPFVQTRVLVPDAAEALKTFIKSLKDAEKTKAKNDVLMVVRAPPRRFVLPEWTDTEQQRAEEYVAAIRAELKKLLA